MILRVLYFVQRILPKWKSSFCIYLGKTYDFRQFSRRTRVCFPFLSHGTLASTRLEGPRPPTGSRDQRYWGNKVVRPRLSLNSRLDRVRSGGLDLPSFRRCGATWVCCKCFRSSRPPGRSTGHPFHVLPHSGLRWCDRTPSRDGPFHEYWEWAPFFRQHSYIPMFNLSFRFQRLSPDTS